MANILDYPEVTDLQAADTLLVIRGGVYMGISGATILSGITNEDPFKMSIINDPNTSKSVYVYDNNTYRRFTSSSPTTLTFPAIADVNLPVNWKMHIRQAGTGAVTIMPGSDYTVNKLTTDTYTLAGQGSTVTLVCTSPGVIDIMGQLTAA